MLNLPTCDGMLSLSTNFLHGSNGRLDRICRVRQDDD